MQKLPRASGDKHIAALKKAGWRLNHIEGSHHILVKDGSDVHLSVPVHKGKDLGIGLLKKLIARAGLTNEEYIELFYKNSISLTAEICKRISGEILFVSYIFLNISKKSSRLIPACFKISKSVELLISL